MESIMETATQLWALVIDGDVIAGYDSLQCAIVAKEVWESKKDTSPLYSFNTIEIKPYR